MSAAVALDPTAARPLTSREISKVLCSILAGVIIVDPNARAAVPDVIAAVRAGHVAERVDRIVSRATRAELVRNLIPMHVPASWAAALSATVSGLRGWCAPADITTALAWVADNVDVILPPVVASPN